MQVPWISSEAFPVTVMSVVVVAYVISLLGVIIVELHPRGRIGRVAAISSIFFVTIGGVAWSYQALHEKSKWPIVVAHQPAEVADEAQPRRQSSRRGREIDTEVDDDSAGSGSDGGQGRAASNTSSGGRSSGSSNSSIAEALGLANRVEDDALAKSDCDGCPPMIMVPAGAAVIGAPDSDPDATSAERPQRQVRFWPGYMISAEPVSAASFSDFLTETGRRVWSCGPKTASRDWPSSIAVADTSDATCLMPGDADAYAAWLSSRTGMTFRLPKASEWEFAARTLSPELMRRSDVAELVADCWHPVLPEQGRERIAATASILDCDGRTVMGAPRVSTRVQLGAREASATIGFRVMRPMKDGR